MKGQTVISEALLAIGIILVAIAFVFIGGNIINFQTEGLFTSTEERLPEEINNRINSLPESTGSYSTTYDPGISTYTLTVQGKTINAEIGEQTQSSTTVTEYRLENTRISNSQTICIKKEGINVSLKPGKCVETNLTDFCENSRCINNICQPERGERCSNAQGDCLCPDDAESGEASGVCDTDYEAKSFINADTSGKDTTELGCVKKDYIDVQSQGEKCSQKFECSSGLSCNSPHHSTTGLSDKRCCPDGSSWNGSACQDDERYNVVIAPALYSNQNNFENDAENAFNYFVSKSPFKQCSNPGENIKKTVLDISSCNINNCDASKNNPGCFDKMKQCADDQLGVGNWNKIIGLAKGDGPLITVNGQTGMICGRAESIPGSVSVTYSSCGVKTAAHETGHAVGLYHISTPGNNEQGTCQGPNSADCNEPASDKRSFLMSYANQRTQYGPAGYSYMEEDVLDKYLDGC